MIALHEITLDSRGELLRRLESVLGMRTADGTLFGGGAGRYGNVILSLRPLGAGHLHDYLSQIGNLEVP